MKLFAVLIILTALGLFGTAFFGVYTAPGLEDLPTYESMGGGKEKKGKSDAKTEKGGQTNGIFPVNSKGKANERRNYLEKKKKEVAPRG